MGSIAEQHNSSTSPALQRCEIVSPIFQNAALVRRADQTLYRFVPAREHSQEFSLAPFGRVNMAGIGVAVAYQVNRSPPVLRMPKRFPRPQVSLLESGEQRP